MAIEIQETRELFAEARAIYFAMLNGAITSKQAKLRTKPILRRINTTVALIAKEHNVKPKYVRFQDLGVNL